MNVKKPDIYITPMVLVICIVLALEVRHKTLGYNIMYKYHVMTEGDRN